MVRRAGAAPAAPNSLIGSATDWVDTLERAVDLRMDAFVFWPVGDDAPEQARRFTEEVAPRVRIDLV